MAASAGVCLCVCVCVTQSTSHALLLLLTSITIFEFSFSKRNITPSLTYWNTFVGWQRTTFDLYAKWISWLYNCANAYSWKFHMFSTFRRHFLHDFFASHCPCLNVRPKVFCVCIWMWIMTGKLYSGSVREIQCVASKQANNWAHNKTR